MAGLTLVAATSLIFNTMNGPALLALPWAFAQCGGALGILFILMSVAMSFLGMHLLAAAFLLATPKLSMDSEPTLRAVCRKNDLWFLLGVWELGVVLGCGGCLITALIIVGNSLENIPPFSRQVWIILAFCCVAFPLSCFRRIAFLRYSSYVSFAVTVYIVCLAIVKSIPNIDCFAIANSLLNGATEEKHLSALSGLDWKKNLQAIPVLALGFIAHQNIISMTNSLEGVTIKRVDVVISSALVVSTVMFGSVCAAAFVTFGSSTPEDLLLAYEDGLAVKIARMGIAVVCLAAFPNLVQPVRNILLGWVSIFTHQMVARASCQECLDASDSVAQYPGTLQASPVRLVAGSGFGEEVNGDAMCHRSSKTPDRHTNGTFFIVTALLGGLALSVSMVTQSLGSIYSLVGGVAFGLFCDICPAWLYLTVTKNDGSATLKGLSYVLLLYGLIMVPTTILANLL